MALEIIETKKQLIAILHIDAMKTYELITAAKSEIIKSNQLFGLKA